jgi:hypothetical protein
MNSVALCVPCYGGQIHAKTAKSIAVALRALDVAGLHVEWMTIEHESLVQRARNVLAHLFLKSRCERMVFIDADIVFHPQSLANLLERNEDLVGAAYPRKCINWESVRTAAAAGEPDLQRYAADFVVNVLRPHEGVVEAPVRDSCLVEVEALATGFLSISRECLYKMCEAYPETVYSDDSRQHAGEGIHALFDGGIVGQRYLSEDYLFCHRWRAIGGQCWLHIGIPLGHIGQHTYAGDLHTVFQPVVREVAA